MNDLIQLLPHCKKDNKLDTKNDRNVINEVADMKVWREGRMNRGGVGGLRCGNYCNCNEGVREAELLGDLPHLPPVTCPLFCLSLPCGAGLLLHLPLSLFHTFSSPLSPPRGTELLLRHLL